MVTLEGIQTIKKQENHGTESEMEIRNWKQKACWQQHRSNPGTVSGCSMLAQKEYNRRQDKVSLNIHWVFCKKYGVKVCERWYEHMFESAIENDNVKILWDVCIQVDRQVEHRRPDIVVMEKNTKKCLIFHVACPVNNNLILKRNEKLDNYSELRLEIARMWDKETVIVPIIIGALGSIPNNLECNLKELCISYNVGTS